ncbi:MAG: PRC-barrel domain containing protein [Chloroflexi bacterium]|nr:MAG: PRC-barrel domain containing protein [Chloroflexota bacterium]
MLRSLKDLLGTEILATDGPIGKVHDFYFDDGEWTVRYMVADTGGWLTGRLVLISPVSLGEADWNARSFPVNLTKREIEDSPGIDADRPVSRQREIELARYYRWPAYWTGGLFTAGTVGMAPEIAVPETVAEQQKGGAGGEGFFGEQEGDPHLRALREVTGYRVQAPDGEIGHVDDLLTDDETWTIRYLDIETRNWRPGKHVLFSPRWVGSVSWDESKVFVEAERQVIKNAPEYRPGMAVNRAFEEELHRHYGRAGYWAEEPQPARR